MSLELRSSPQPRSAPHHAEAEAADSEQEQDTVLLGTSLKSAEAVSRHTELRTRLRLLEARHESGWGAKEMRLVLAAGGVPADDVTDKEDLRERVRSLQSVARARWDAEAAAEAAALVVAASDRASIDSHRTAARKFRARGAASGKKSSEGNETNRSEESCTSEEFEDDMDSIDIPDGSRRTGLAVPDAYRSSFRTKGAAYAAAVLTQSEPLPPPSKLLFHSAVGALSEPKPEDNDMFAKVKAVLVPEFVKGTLWEEYIESFGHKVGKCVTPRGSAPNTVVRAA